MNGCVKWLTRFQYILKARISHDPSRIAGPDARQVEYGLSLPWVSKDSGYQASPD